MENWIITKNLNIYLYGYKIWTNKSGNYPNLYSYFIHLQLLVGNIKNQAWSFIDVQCFIDQFINNIYWENFLLVKIQNSTDSNYLK